MVSSPTSRNTAFECDICGDVFPCKQNKYRHKKRHSSLLPGADDFFARIAFIEKQMLVLTMEHAYLKEKESVASVTNNVTNNVINNVTYNVTNNVTNNRTFKNATESAYSNVNELHVKSMGAANEDFVTKSMWKKLVK
eukprot:gene396-1792_t